MELELRVAALERSARRWRAAACVLAVGGLVAVGVGAATTRPDVQVQDVIRARRIEVVDGDGKPMIVATVEDGNGGISVGPGCNPPFTESKIGIFGGDKGCGILGSTKGQHRFELIGTDTGGTFEVMPRQ